MLGASVIDPDVDNAKVNPIKTLAKIIISVSAVVGDFGSLNANSERTGAGSVAVSSHETAAHNESAVSTIPIKPNNSIKHISTNVIKTDTPNLSFDSSRADARVEKKKTITTRANAPRPGVIKKIRAIMALIARNARTTIRRRGRLGERTWPMSPRVRWSVYGLPSPFSARKVQDASVAGIGLCRPRDPSGFVFWIRKPYLSVHRCQTPLFSTGPDESLRLRSFSR